MHGNRRLKSAECRLQTGTTCKSSTVGAIWHQIDTKILQETEGADTWRFQMKEPFTRPLLRRLLGDESRDPRYIETVVTVGYRLVCKVEAVEDPVGVATAPDPTGNSCSVP
jgi:hypothetical protein